MSDLIRREDVLAVLCFSQETGQMVCGDLRKLLEEIKAIPSAEPERKTFHIIDKKTGKEADPYDIALNEEWAKSLMYCDMEGFAILEDGTLILVDECGRCEFIQEEDRFEVIWDEVTNDDTNS